MTKYFFDSFLVWGIKEKLMVEGKERISARVNNLTDFYTIARTFEGEEEYRLLDYWKEGIYNIVNGKEEYNEKYEAIVREFKEAERKWELLIKKNYLFSMYEDLETRSGLFSPIHSDAWYLVGDIAKLWNLDINALKSATDFFKEYYQEYAELLECDYLKKTLSLLWKKAINVASDEDCDSGIGFYKELISLDPEDFWSYWMLGKFSEKTNPEEALNWYIQSAVIQNTSKGYGGLISKIKDYRKTQRLPKDIELEYLDLQEKAAMKAIECDAINFRNWDALSDALEDKGRVFLNQRKYQKAINNFDSAIKADEKRVKIGEMLQILPHEDEILYHHRIHKIAGILSERAEANEQLGRLDNTIQDLDAAIAKWSYGGRRLGDADAAIKILPKDKERIEQVKKNLGILNYLCDVANAAIEGEKTIVDLPEMRYWLKKLLEEVNPAWIEGNIDEVTGYTEKDHNRRMEALNTFLFDMNDRVEEIVDILNKTIIPEELRKIFLKQGHSLKKMQLRTLQESNKWKIYGRNKLYFIQRNKKNRLSIYENKNPILEIFHSIFSATIATFHAINTININDTIKSDRKKQKQIKSNLAHRWGKIGRRINEINKGFVYIPHEVVIKCYEISTNPRLYPNNNASFDGLGWELFNAGEFEKAKEAFNTVITIEEEAKKAGGEKKNRYSHDATAGIGKVYELKGHIQSAEAYYKDSAKRCIRLHGESNPFEAIKSLKKTAENLKDLRFFDVSEDEKIRFLEDTLEVYNEGLKLSQRIGLSPKIEEFQERIRLVKKQIKFIEEKKIPHKLLLREVLEAPIDGLLSIESNSKNISALFNKGNALYKLGRNEEAIRYYDMSLEFDHENIFVLINKGETLNRLKSYNEALECFETVLKSDPNNVIALDNKGFVLSKLGKDNEAIEWFEKALKLGRKYTSAWINKGFSLSKLEKYEEAIKCYDDAIGIEPDNAAAWKNKGFALEKIGRYEEEALECYEKAIDIEPDNAATWRFKGHLLEKLGRQEEASKSFEIASDLFAKRKGVSRKDFRDILQEINENPEDYDLFKQIFDAKFSDDMEIKSDLMAILDEIVSMSLKQATKDSPFEISTKIFQSCQKLCEELYGDEYKRKFTDLFNSRVIPRFRKIVLGDEYKMGPIESDEELKTLLREFERTFGDLGVKIPLLEEIEDEIKKWLKSKGKPIK